MFAPERADDLPSAPFGMPHNTFVWVEHFTNLTYHKVKLKRSEFPKNTVLVTCWDGSRKYRQVIKPVNLGSNQLEHSKQGHAYKVAPRGGRVKQWNNPYSEHAHVAEIKRHARRTARRKARQLLRNISDPEGEYNSRYLPGVTYKQWK